MLTLVPGSMGGSETYAGELVKQLATRSDVDVVTGLASSARDFATARDRHCGRNRWRWIVEGSCLQPTPG